MLMAFIYHWIQASKGLSSRSQLARLQRISHLKEWIQALGRFFKLTLHHMFSLYCIFSSFLPLHIPRSGIQAESLFLCTLYCQRRLRAYTRGHYSSTAHREKTVELIETPHKPICPMQDLDLQNLTCLPTYNLPTFEAMSQDCRPFLSKRSGRTMRQNSFV